MRNTPRFCGLHLLVLLFQIQISRQLPAGRGPRGSVVLGLVTLTMAVGYYKLGQANKGRRAEKHEKRMARIALMPMLQVRGGARHIHVNVGIRFYPPAHVRHPPYSFAYLEELSNIETADSSRSPGVLAVEQVALVRG